jgi:hypothetical protein
MTLQESIDEIRCIIRDLEPYLFSQDRAVLHRAQGRYKSLLDRFFRENVGLLAPHQKTACLEDVWTPSGSFAALIR